MNSKSHDSILDWDSKTVAQLGEIFKGKGASKAEVVPCGYPCIRYGEIYTHHDFIIKRFNSFLDDNGRLNAQEITKGDLIFAGSGETHEDIGKSVAYVGSGKAYAGGDTIILRPKEHDSNFLAYLLNGHSARRQMSLLAQGSTIIHLYGSALAQVQVQVPKIKEQKKIAEILTSVDDVIELTEKEIEKLQMLKKGMMQELLTKGIGHTKFKESSLISIPDNWQCKRISDTIFQCIYGPRFNAENYDTNGNVKTIRGTDVEEDGTLDYMNCPPANLDEKLIKTHILAHHDVVVVTTADCGVTAVFEDHHFPYIPSAYMVKLRFDLSQINPFFFKYLMQLDIMKKQIEGCIRKGTVANLPGSDLTNFWIPVPPKNEQDIIVEIISSIETTILTKQNAKNSVLRLKYGLMQDLLSGKTRVKTND